MRYGYCFPIKTKWQSAQWKKTDSMPLKKFLVFGSGKKMMVTMFCDSEGLIHCVCLPQLHPTNMFWGNSTFQHANSWLEMAACLLFLQDNDPAHWAVLTHEFLITTLKRCLVLPTNMISLLETQSMWPLTLASVIFYLYRTILGSHGIMVSTLWKMCMCTGRLCWEMTEFITFWYK